MNLEQTNPESLIVLRDGEIDDEYYDQVYELKRHEALDSVKRELLHRLLGIPAKLGQGVLYAMAHIAEQAN